MSGIVRQAPPWNAYSVSHQTQRSGQPVRRTNTVGRPTSRASPCSEWKISVMRSRSALRAGESARNLWSNLEVLTSHDQIKIVLADRADYDWAHGVIAEHALAERCDILLSPVHGKLAPRELAEWILADRLPVRMQIQLHKILWGEEAGH